jgi:diguanylate cyclase (GGDEF)-like protein
VYFAIFLFLFKVSFYKPFFLPFDKGSLKIIKRKRYNMKRYINHYRFYGLGRSEYKKAMERVFYKNITSLRRTNAVISILLTGFLFVPLYIDKNVTKVLFFAGAAVIAALLYLFIRIKYPKNNPKQPISKKRFYTLLFLTYLNVIFLGIYLGVWANPGSIAGLFLVILICALLLFNIPPLLHFFLTACSALVFISLAVMVKSPAEWLIDVPNALFASAMGLFFGWQVIMNRLSLASVANKMEDERDNYLDQSTVDELTQLKNRRDFITTFNRFLNNPRHPDNFLCIAILDIDFFKRYNDHYGHLKGDECLREVGKALKSLHNNMSIYSARVGGEEFALIWFEKEIANVENVISLIITTIKRLNIPHEKSHVAPHVTVSMGIHVLRSGNSGDINTYYDLADKALYTAKRSGRNRAIVSYSDFVRLSPKPLPATA